MKASHRSWLKYSSARGTSSFRRPPRLPLRSGVPVKLTDDDEGAGRRCRAVDHTVANRLDGWKRNRGLDSVHAVIVQFDHVTEVGADGF